MVANDSAIGSMTERMAVHFGDPAERQTRVAGAGTIS